ncbi:hypothetical protein MYP_4476 [Sporocytophaga myxococcoides]|uniref:Phage abortive infection protein n=1 Tax=Sporocytophaga myxococcoides TaxID=153721 RepID=A0A098LJW3_9BACT|nr:putative phage abortive infection protein [Sporocytophaga myxococcoides]GAL87246.1 hypothetical protein MYP_4476 [Sporocytophaga myxococcoides]
MDLEKDIEETSERIKNRQSKITSELSILENKINLYTNWAWGFVWSGIVVSIFSILYFICKNSEEGFALNLLGDFLGGSVASIWALAGLFFIYVAFLGQKQQLLNQQLELMYSQLEVKYTRLELAGQKEEMKEQNSTLKQQRFENTFFQLISLFNTIVTSLDIRDRKTKVVTTSGRECFNIFYLRLRHHLKNIKYGEASTNDKLDDASIADSLKAYDTLYDNEKADLSHYFRVIYRIFKFIDNSDIDDKSPYAAIARAQLSSYEQIIIFYNCLHVHGREKFKPLIEKYAVLKNLDDSLIINHKHLEEYDRTAYGQ